MASPAVALPNGLAEPAHHDHNSVDVEMTDAASHQSSPAKRKREPSLNGAAPDGTAQQQQQNHQPAAEQPGQARASANGASSHPRHPSIRDYLLVLERFDATPSVLKRPLPDPDAADEPSAKRKRAEDGSSLPSIADKAARDEYSHLEAVVADIKVSVKDQLDELRSIDADKTTKADDAAIARTIAFEQKARELFRRESTYPSLTQNAAVLRTLDASNNLQSNASGNMVLSVYGEAPRNRQLYSSLQQRVPTPDNPDGAVQPLRQNGLPLGIKTVKAVPFSFPSAVEKDKKAKTLGELFPAPRNLPSLQPPKAPKSTTKGVQVGWHRPELTEKSKYRTGTYFGQPLSTGRWLDYSQAAPPSQIIPKERERAMSLAGTKPSSDDLDKTEMESLFRGAFSSFAPSKDDSAAMVSSGMISQTMWWQKYGKRSFDRLVEAEAFEETAEESTNTEEDVDLDDALLQEAIENWDTRVDPSLEDMCNPKKSKEEQDADDILQDVSDMIQTLVSFQKNRNLTLPSAANQSRYSADPAHSDMLTSGTPAQPSEEETLTYETLKAQLVLVIQMLPPYAVARLNSDKLEELNISTKLEVRADEYQGVMEEDEAAARTRAAAAQQASSVSRPPSHRSTSSTGGLQYGAQFGATNRAPMATPGYYGPQTPGRPPSVSRPTPGMPPSYTPQQRPPSNAGYRPAPNGYPGGTNFVQQMARAQPPYGQQPPNAYAATPPPNRPPYQQPPPYHNMPNNTNTPPRYGGQPPQSAQAPHYPQHGYPQHQQPPGTPSHPPHYNPYAANGGPGIPPRTVSPQVAHQQPQYMQQQPPPQGYNPSATPSRQPPQYGPQPTPVGAHPQQRFYPPTGSPQVGPPHAPPGNPPPGQHNPQQGTSFQTSLQPHQVQQAMDQAKARFNAHTKAQDGIRPLPAQGQQVAAPVGLGGIGLGGARPNMPGAVNYNTPSPSPKPQTNSPAIPAMQVMPQAPMNGTPGPAPAVANGNADPHTNA